MSSYLKKLKHPTTGKEQVAACMDDYFKRHEYGYFFMKDGTDYNWNSVVSSTDVDIFSEAELVEQKEKKKVEEEVEGTTFETNTVSPPLSEPKLTSLSVNGEETTVGKWVEDIQVLQRAVLILEENWGKCPKEDKEVGCDGCKNREVMEHIEYTAYLLQEDIDDQVKKATQNETKD